jgi:putative ABC transport system permease protein
VGQFTRKWPSNTLLLLTVALLAALFTFVQNSARFTERSMQLIVKRMGHNMLILPRDADALAVLHCADHQMLFSDTVADALAGRTELLSKYYVPRLQRRIEIEGTQVILTGMRPVKRADETAEKGNMVAPVAPGSVRLGAEAARILSRNVGDTVAILGSVLRVAQIARPEGTDDDYRVYVDLSQAQRVLELPGKINAIVAFECLHVGSLDKAEQYQQEHLDAALPGYRHISKMEIARGRYLARNTTSSFLRIVLMLVMSVTALIVAIAGWHEVNERKGEIGIMISMGATRAYIAGLYVVKMVVMGVVAGAAGFAAGGWLSVRQLMSFAVYQTQPPSVQWGNLPTTLAVTCAAVLVAGVIPIVRLASLEPSRILVEE